MNNCVSLREFNEQGLYIYIYIYIYIYVYKHLLVFFVNAE